MRVDLSTLPPPALIEPLDYEAVLAAMRADLAARLPEIVPTLALESSVVSKVLQVVAYREVLLRARINDAALGLLLARARGADLDQIAANFGVARLTVLPEDQGRPAVMEDDTRLRRRVTLAIEAYSVAGPADAYIYHALTALPSLRDASAISSAPGQVTVTLYASRETPAPTLAERQAVAIALNARDVRPLTDVVAVVGPEIVEAPIVAALSIYPGPDPTVVLARARASLEAWLEEVAYLGRDLRRSAIFSRLHVDGVQSVALASPAADIIGTARTAIRVAGIDISIA